MVTLYRKYCFMVVLGPSPLHPDNEFHSAWSSRSKFLECQSYSDFVNFPVWAMYMYYEYPYHTYQACSETVFYLYHLFIAETLHSPVPICCTALSMCHVYAPISLGPDHIYMHYACYTRRPLSCAFMVFS